MKDSIINIAHLEYKKKLRQDAGGGILSTSMANYRSIISRCNNVWWTILDEVLNDHVVNVRDDVVGFQHTLHAMHNLALMKVKSLHRLLHHQ
jgi:hypothetical protein